MPQRRSVTRATLSERVRSNSGLCTPTTDSPALQLTGRTHCDRIVVFNGNPRQIGHFLPVIIYDANAHTLFGEVVTRHTGSDVYTLAIPSMV